MNLEFGFRGVLKGAYNLKEELEKYIKFRTLEILICEIELDKFPSITFRNGKEEKDQKESQYKYIQRKYGASLIQFE